MRVGVTGATGFVGRAVVTALRRRGDEVTVLTRDPAAASMPADVLVTRFDANETEPNPAPFEGLDAVIHLAGETVDGRWTPAKKRAIFDSRVAGTRNLVSSLAACSRRPRALIAASAVGYFGDRGDEPLDEGSPPGSDFLAGVCIGWEREAQAATKLGVRVASVRVSMVLGTGGAVGKLVPIFRLGVGGPLGSGRQWMPWIHLDDLAELFCFVAQREDISGPVCAVAADYATNHRFLQGLGAALGKPALLPAPGLALKIVIGEFADTLLGGQLIIPTKALDAGFTWKHPKLEPALIELLAPQSGRKPAVQSFGADQFLPAPLARVFAFFSDASNLERFAPPWAGLRMTTPQPVEMRAGAIIEYTLRVRGVRVAWKSMVSEWVPGVRFADVQVRGPYLLWRHTHEFVETEGGVIVRDRIDYALPFAPLSNFALPAVRRDIESVFAFRRRAVEEIFAN
jgi:uncharacterized protein